MELQSFVELLPQIIPSDLPVVVGSDLDETLCGKYFYDDGSKTHLPILLPELITQAERIRSPLLISTARTPKEEEFWQISKVLLGGKNNPVICENGTLIYFPNDVSKKTISLLTDEQNDELQRLKAEVPTIYLSNTFSNRGAEVLIRSNRLTSIDFRIQNIDTKQGMPELYYDLLNFIEEQFDLDGFVPVSSHNSLSIQPKSCNKLTGIEKVLELMQIPRENIFLIGLGDAENDKELLEGSNLGIAVRKDAAEYADICVDMGEITSLALLSHLN